MKALVLEDETLAGEKIVRLVREIDDEIEISGPLKSIESTLDWFQKNPSPDFMICDIRLEDGLSFEIFGKINFEGPVIFTTAYDQYAIKAFEVNSVDYLLKPVQKEKLEASLAKLKKSYHAEKQPEIPYNEIMKFLRREVNEHKSRFVLKVGNKIIAIPVDKIAYFCSQDKMTYIVTTEGKKFPHDQPLEVIDEQLDPRKFFRANRKYIIKFEAISEIHPHFKGRVKIRLKSGDEDIVVSSEKTPEFKNWLDQ